MGGDQGSSFESTLSKRNTGCESDGTSKGSVGSQPASRPTSREPPRFRPKREPTGWDLDQTVPIIPEADESKTIPAKTRPTRLMGDRITRLKIITDTLLKPTVGSKPSNPESASSNGSSNSITQMVVITPKRIPSRERIK